MEVDFREAVRKFSLMYLCSFKWFSFELAYIRTVICLHLKLLDTSCWSSKRILLKYLFEETCRPPDLIGLK